MSWRVEETYVKVRGHGTYLHRALDKHGDTIDFYLSPIRNANVAKRFLGNAVNGLRDWEKPDIINTDKAPAYGLAISELKAEGKCRETSVRFRGLHNQAENWVCSDRQVERRVCDQFTIDRAVE